MCHTWTTLKPIRAVSRNAQPICTNCEASSTLAAVHAVGDHAAHQREQEDGDLAQEGVEAQQEGEPEIVSTSQLWATFCIQVPMLEVQAPNHISRKSRSGML